MVRFYDSEDARDLARVEGILRKNGIEYCLAADSSQWPVEILVAEEDVPRAEALLQKAVGD